MEEEKPQALLPRPVFLSVICLFSFVFFLILTMLFLISLFFSGRISDVIMTYLPEEEMTKTQVFLFITAGLVLHGSALTGTVLIWKLKKAGYLFLGIPCLIMASYQLFQPQITVAMTGIYILMILLFGLFYRRLR